MGCNCNKGPRESNGMMIRESRLPISESGLFEVLVRDGAEPYHGQFRTADVWVVGIGTEVETYFPRGRKADALAAYKRALSEGRTTFDHVLARNCRHEDMVSLLGA